MNDEKQLLEKIAENVIQGRVIAADEGFDEDLEGQPAVTELVNRAMEENIDPKKIVLESLTGPMETVGEKFDRGEYRIPDMLASAECVGAAMDILSLHLADVGVKSRGRFVLATVAGDHHDVGKKIVAALLKGAGFEVTDLGNDVAADRIVEAIRESGAGYLGLSALLTTTMREMEGVIQGLEKEGLREKIRVLIGGTPVSEEYSTEIGADAYCRDAFHAIDILKKMASS